MSRAVLTGCAAGILLLGVSSAAFAREPAGERAADPRDKVICKRFIETGSLVRGYRSCKPKREWERERDNLRQFNVSDSCRDRANGGGLCR